MTPADGRGAFDVEIVTRGDVEIVACPNGPLLVRGDADIIDSHGDAVPRTRSTVALCRCGVSGILPWCDGSHKLVDFRTDASPPAV